MRHRWSIIIDNGRDDGRGPYTAYVPNANGGGDEDDTTPWKATGDTPVLAMAALAAILAEWPKGAADRWLDTPRGTAFKDHFVYGEAPAPYPKVPERGKA